MKLHIDIETYSSVDISKAGAYKYIESIDFEILLVAYAFGHEDIQIIDLARGEKLTPTFLKALNDPDVQKCAHNAVFERKAFEAIGLHTPAEQWHCSAVKSAYCGLPLSLDQVSKALKLGEDKAKLSTGKALIKYFSCPVKPTKVNGQRHRNLPEHDLEKWGLYKIYCVRDVEAEREIDKRLERYQIPEFERRNYLLDQDINDRGIMVDLVLAANAYEIDQQFSKELTEKMKQLTGLENPNSVAQLKEWLSNATGKVVNSLAKDVIPELLEGADDTVSEVLRLRQQGSKSSTKKYKAMLECTCDDNRAHGLFQFYGANRTGRWAGRLVQLQNLPQNKIKELDEARQMVASNDYDSLDMVYGDQVPTILSQLIRTAFVAPQGHTFAVADFSAIEARVIAWLADERWRLDVFNSHGKIYEASASKMFGVPLDEVDSELRAKGKVAELALGYQGAVGALRQMGGEAMGLNDEEMQNIVTSWRRANPAIKTLWHVIENAAKKSIKLRCRVTGPKGLEFNCDENYLMVELPSGRSLFYYKPSIGSYRYGSESIKYRGMDQTTKQWTFVDSYGGKLVENIVQAIARDLLAFAMLRLDEAGFKIVMHVHDEAICEIQDSVSATNYTQLREGRERDLETMCGIMGESVYWAPGLPLRADGYLTPYYKKD
jgi:DNA polymerase